MHKLSTKLLKLLSTSIPISPNLVTKFCREYCKQTFIYLFREDKIIVKANHHELASEKMVLLILKIFSYISYRESQ